MSSKSPSVITVQGTRQFTIADGLNWRRITSLVLDPAIYNNVYPSKVSVYAGMAGNNTVQVRPFASSLELALVPHDDTSFITGPQLPYDAVALGWLWGLDAAGNSFKPQVGIHYTPGAGSYQICRPVMTHAGVMARRWDVWGRGSFGAGETLTPTAWVRIIGEIGGEQAWQGEKINSFCTVPPWIPAEFGIGADLFPEAALGQPSDQRSISPAMWRSRYMTLTVQANWSYRFIMGGGPWRGGFYALVTGAVPSGWYGEHRNQAAAQCPIQGAALNTLGGNYYPITNSLDSAWHHHPIPGIICAAVATGALAVNETLTLETFCHRGLL